MYLLIPYILVPLALWAYLYFRNRKDASPKTDKIINTLGSTLVIFGIVALLTDWINIRNINIKMSLIMIAGFFWAIYFYFFFNRRKQS